MLRLVQEMPETRFVVLMRKSSNGNYTKGAETLIDHRIAVVLSSHIRSHIRFLHQHAFKQHMTIHCSNATAEFRPMTPEYVLDWRILCIRCTCSHP
jgi:hypothetical protein